MESCENEPEYSAQWGVVQREAPTSSTRLDPLALRQILPKYQKPSQKNKIRPRKQEISDLGFVLRRRVSRREGNSLAQIMAKTIKDFPARFLPRAFRGEEEKRREERGLVLGFSLPLPHSRLSLSLSLSRSTLSPKNENQKSKFVGEMIGAWFGRFRFVEPLAWHKLNSLVAWHANFNSDYMKIYYTIQARAGYVTMHKCKCTYLILIFLFIEYKNTIIKNMYCSIIKNMYSLIRIMQYDHQTYVLFDQSLYSFSIFLK